jgi:hypothetical protein
VDQTELDAILTETAERGPFVQTAAELSKKNNPVSLEYQAFQSIPVVAGANVSALKGVPCVAHTAEARRLRSITDPDAVCRTRICRYDRCDVIGYPNPPPANDSYTDMTNRSQG